MADLWHVSLSLLIFNGSFLERLYQLPILKVHLSQDNLHCPKLASSTVYNYGTPLFNLLRIEQNSKFKVDSRDLIFFISGKIFFGPYSIPFTEIQTNLSDFKNAANLGHFHKVQRCDYLTSCSQHFKKIDRFMQYLGNNLSIGENFIVLCECKVDLIAPSKKKSICPKLPSTVPC